MIDNKYSVLKSRLEQEQQRLRLELAQIQAGSNSETVARSRTHTAEAASETSELEKSLALEKTLLGLLRDVERALGKFETDTYGICDRCNSPIDPERLEALPHANLCIDCKAQQEHHVHD